MLLPDRSSRPRPYLWFVSIGIAVVGIAASSYIYVQVDHTSRQNIIDRVNILAQALPAADVAALQGSAADLASPQYQELKALMMREEAVNNGIRFIYLIGTEPNGTLFFYGDSEDPSSPDYSPPGQEYPEATPAMHAFFENGGKSLAEGPDQDRWGIWISAYAPVRDANGKLLAMLGMDVPAGPYLLDLITYASLPLLVALILIIIFVAVGTRRTRKEQELTQKAEFLSVASHQIRTPLIGIRWALEQVLASKDSTFAARDRDTLELTHESSLGLIARVNNLLDVSAIESRGTHPVTQSVLMRPLLEDIASSLTLSAKRKQVEMIIDDTVAPDLELAGDRQTLQHIFFNLLGNAVKYTRANTAITVSYGWSTDGHQFSITDHGLGIAPAEQERIFTGYHRTQQAMESGESGSGLGLYLTKKLVESMKGSISVHSAVGKGSTFTVTLPN